MKKLIAILLMLVMVLGLFTACSEPPAPSQAPEPEEKIVYTPISILGGTLAKYQKDDVVFNVSLDMNINLEENSDLLQSLLYIPEEQMESVIGASIMLHMNQSFFTGAALELAEGTDPVAFAETLKDAISTTQWLCGSPEKLMVATVSDSFVVVAYGLDNDESPLITTFQNRLKDAHGEDAVILETVDLFM